MRRSVHLCCLLLSLSLLTACAQQTAQQPFTLPSPKSHSRPLPSPDPAQTHPSSPAPPPFDTPPDVPMTITPNPTHIHDYLPHVTLPTCTDDGYTTFLCSCGHQYQDQITPATGHSFGDWVITAEPTTSTQGTKVRTCPVCGQEEQATIPILQDTGHLVAQVVALINQERTNHGLPALTAVGSLNGFAQTRSQELVTRFDHIRPDGSNPLNVVISLGNYSTAGENIAMGYSSPQAVVRGWMNSPGHRANILSADFSFVGIGCHRHNGTLYWTQIFAG